MAIIYLKAWLPSLMVIKRKFQEASPSSFRTICDLTSSVALEQNFWVKRMAKVQWAAKVVTPASIYFLWKQGSWLLWATVQRRAFSNAANPSTVFSDFNDGFGSDWFHLNLNELRLNFIKKIEIRAVDFSSISTLIFFISCVQGEWSEA